MGVMCFFFVRLFDLMLFVSDEGMSKGSRLCCLRTTCEALRRLHEAAGKRCEAFRCRLINEVRVSSDFENRSETSGFHSADVLSGSENSAEPVVNSRACDAISA